MAIQTTPGVGVARVHEEWYERRWWVTGHVVVLLWLIVLVGTVFFGEREADLRDLHDALSDGAVSQVEIVGLPESDDWRGSATVTLRWRGRIGDRYTEVLVANPNKRAGQTSGQNELPVVVGDPTESLQAIDPDVRVTRSEWKSGAGWTLWGWEAPSWAGMGGLVAWLGGFGLLLSGPQPWRATRWAWGWLFIFGGPLGIGAYLLLGGPLGVGQPHPRGYRLTGGWAFLLVLFFGGSVLGGFSG